MGSSKTARWTGRVISWFFALFLLFDGTLHVINPKLVVEAFARLGFSDSLGLALGLFEFGAVALYLAPRSSLLGAILLTGYLGGATAAQVRIGGPSWFSILVGVMLWTGLCLQDDRLRALLPWRARS